VDVNCVNKADPFAILVGEKMTPIMLAACIIPRGKLDIFFMLLNHPKIDLTITNSRGHTVRDITFMQEIEFLTKPMTDALTKHARCPALHRDANAIKHFEIPGHTTWWTVISKDDKDVEVEGVDSQKWNDAIAAIPFYKWSAWLKSIIRYDWLARKKELKSEKWHQGLELAKIGGFKASYVTAHGLRYVGSGKTVSEAAKLAVKKTEQFWWIVKGQCLRGYDKEYMLAKMDGTWSVYKTTASFNPRAHPHPHTHTQTQTHMSRTPSDAVPYCSLSPCPV
jgi:hypothetical protein